MNNKSIIFLIIVLCNTALLGMNDQKSLLLKNIPTDIETQIFKFANITQQWWYLDKKFEHKSNAIYFDYKKNQFEAKVHDNNDISIIDLKTNKQIDYFNLNCWVLTASISPSKNFLATGSGTNYARLFDMQQLKEIASFDVNGPVFSFSFDPSEKFLAITSCATHVRIFDIKTYKNIANFQHHTVITATHFGSVANQFATNSWDNETSIFIRHTDYTVEQLILKNALLTWLLIEKPDQKINSPKKLLKDIALKFEIPSSELLKTYATFPENMQKSLWRTIHYKIFHYGKDVHNNAIL